jgi:hypothetical protein
LAAPAPLELAARSAGMSAPASLRPALGASAAAAPYARELPGPCGVGRQMGRQGMVWERGAPAHARWGKGACADECSWARRTPRHAGRWWRSQPPGP